MKLLVVVLGLCVAALGSDVLEYTDASFEDGVKEHDVVLVEFFAPWLVGEAKFTLIIKICEDTVFRRFEA